MLFTTFHFLGFFLVVYSVFRLLPRQRLRLGWLVLASLVFYGSWSVKLLFLLLATAGFTYAAGLLLEVATSPGWRKGLLGGALVVNLGLLGFFKYANFALGNVFHLLRAAGLTERSPVVAVLLPLGISFYTFELVSYLVDVYRRRIPAQRDVLHYALYVLFFPRLVAGPIVRPDEFFPQLGKFALPDWDRAQVALQLVLLGLFQKAVLADHLGLAIDPVFADPAAYGSVSVWLAMVGYALQIYCDFAGYSAMALGLARLLGFRLPVNFRMPYLSSDIGEFWHRWHMSLSRWIRDYVYIPLGGSRGGPWMTARNVFLTMTLCGLWHGAGWTFVLWGAYHGALLALHRVVPRPGWWASPSLRPLHVATTFFFCVLGWVPFRAATLADAGLIYQRMLSPVSGAGLDGVALFTVCAVVLLVLACHALARSVSLVRLERRLPAFVLGGGMAVVLLLCQLLLPMSGNVFIYFQF
jgi:alginate O-acetyltransferase complex protein AlgI